MTHQGTRSAVGEVAACTTEAAHRRDHRHDALSGCCHPHVVEVVHLGSRAVMICHDCCTDSGFLPAREAVSLAAGHRQVTRIDAVDEGTRIDAVEHDGTGRGWPEPGWPELGWAAGL